MNTVLYVDGRSGRTGEPPEPAPTSDLRMRVVRGVEAAGEILHASPESFDAILFAWEPRDGIEPVEDILAAVGSAELEVVAVLPRQHAARAEEAIAAGAFWVVTVPCDALHLRRVLKAAADTVELRRGLSRADRDCEMVLDLLGRGAFQFRTPREARLLAERLGSRCPEPQATVALLELMVNAIEHGNLGIEYEEKGALLADGLFEAEVEQRLQDAEYRDRYATLELDRQEAWLDLVITDTGSGFDWSRFQVMDDDRLLHSHGRGVLLASATLEVEYLPPGNRVKVRMPLGDPAATAGATKPAAPAR